MQGSSTGSLWLYSSTTRWDPQFLHNWIKLTCFILKGNRLHLIHKQNTFLNSWEGKSDSHFFVVYSCWSVVSRAKNYFTDPTGYSRSMSWNTLHWRSWWVSHHKRCESLNKILKKKYLDRHVFPLKVHVQEQSQKNVIPRQQLSKALMKLRAFQTHCRWHIRSHAINRDRIILFEFPFQMSWTAPLSQLDN